MPLIFSNIGQTVKVTKILGCDKSRKHILNMGLIEGNQIEIVSFLNGDMIVKIKDTKIAISKEMASRIHVI